MTAIPMSEADLLASWPESPAPEDVFVRLNLQIVPVTKGRARVRPAEYTVIGSARLKTRSARAYTPETTKQFQESIGWLLRSAKVVRNNVDDLGVHAVFYVSTFQRRDLDNLIKSLLDGCNGVAWHDDQQVTRLTSDLVRDSDDPHIELMIYVANRKARNCPKCDRALTSRQITGGRVFCSKECFDSEQRRGSYRACVVCGASVYRTVEKMQNENAYCSPECRTAGRRACQQCGERIEKPPSSNGRFCSTECSVAWHRGRPRSDKWRAPRGTCTDCGGETSNVGAARCRACWIAFRAVNGQGEALRSQYDSCPDCEGRKRTTALRCASCFRANIRAGTAGRWARHSGTGSAA
jgi:crossover junction endodeoxyribonuclease RusA